MKFNRHTSLRLYNKWKRERILHWNTRLGHAESLPHYPLPGLIFRNQVFWVVLCGWVNCCCMIDFLWPNEAIKVLIIFGRQCPWLRNNITSNRVKVWLFPQQKCSVEGWVSPDPRTVQYRLIMYILCGIHACLLYCKLLSFPSWNFTGLFVTVSVLFQVTEILAQWILFPDVRLLLRLQQCVAEK